jgi:integrase/recombinase XerD
MKKLTLVRLFLQMIAFHDKSERLSNARAKVTIQAYKNKYSILCDFLRENKKIKLRADKYDREMAYLYYEWLKTKFCNNYSIRCVEIVNKCLEFGVNEGFINVNNVGSLKLKRTKASKPTYFSPKQIEQWENFNSSDEQLQKAAHLAVLQIHTGFDYGDFKEISRDMVAMYKGHKYIVKPRQKNGNEAIIPMSAKVDAILEFYDYKMDLLSNPDYNLLIKEIAKSLKIDIYVNSKGLRKAFAMDQLNNKGLSIEAVSKMLGHSKVKTTEETYAQVNINLIHNEIIKRDM